MAIKLLENIGIENTGIGASALNNLITGNKSGIVGKYLNECAFTATGNTIIIDKGLLIICGRQVELDAIESITLSSVPSEDVRYQIVIELIREESGEVTASIFARQPSTLIQENLMKDGFVYQFELGRVTHKTTGQVTEALRTADILTAGGGGGADFEIGDVTTEMLAEGIPAEVDIEKRTEDDKTFLDFTFAIPKGDRLVGEDIKDTVTTFIEATTRANIETGEKTSTVFGKVKKWFTDLKPHAFNDLDSVPTNNSTNLVTSGGVKTALDEKQNTLIFDSTPISGSVKPITSGGVYKSTCAVFYRSLTEINPTFTIDTDMVTLITAMENNSIASYEVTGSSTVYPGIDLQVQIFKVNYNRVTCYAYRKVYNSSQQRFYVGGLAGSVGNTYRWAGWNEVATKTMPLLWEGSFNSGSIPVAGISNYKMIAVGVVEPIPLTAVRSADGTRFIGGGVYGNYTYAINMSVSGNTVTYVTCTRIGHSSLAMHSEKESGVAITKIWGVI